MLRTSSERSQPGPDDLAVVELQLGQPAEPQLEEMHPVPAPLPCSRDFACRDKRRSDEADLLDQFASRRRLGRLVAAQGAAGETPFGPIGRTDQQNITTNVDRHQRALVPGAPQPPPDAGERKTEAIRNSADSVATPAACHEQTFDRQKRFLFPPTHGADAPRRAGLGRLSRERTGTQGRRAVASATRIPMPPSIGRHI